MAYVADPTATLWTAVDLVEQLGPIPLHRIVSDPAPGTATVEDVVRLDDHHDRLCELIDGTLVEKTVGVYESYLAGAVVQILLNFLEKSRIGIALTTDGMMQLFPGQVRIPDASFVSWASLEGTGFPDEPVPNMAPDLAVEIISRCNTKAEMDRKLREYFAAGTRLVWYIHPNTKTVQVFTAPDQVAELTESHTLDGGDVLPGFKVDLATFFEVPKKP